MLNCFWQQLVKASSPVPVPARETMRPIRGLGWLPETGRRESRRRFKDLEDGLGPSITFAQDWIDALYLQNQATPHGNIFHSFVNGRKGWSASTDLESWTWPCTENGEPRNVEHLADIL